MFTVMALRQLPLFLGQLRELQTWIQRAAYSSGCDSCSDGELSVTEVWLQSDSGDAGQSFSVAGGLAMFAVGK
jgi:hypothetical protein